MVQDLPTRALSDPPRMPGAGSQQLNAPVQLREVRIAELEHAAAERLDALQRAEVVHRDTVEEAERRARPPSAWMLCSEPMKYWSRLAWRAPSSDAI
jgi:hypothetical protein